MEEFNILCEIVNELYSINKETLISKKRKRELVELRYICANILRISEKYTVEEIGELLKIDHSTVSYAKKQHEPFMNPKNSRTYSKTYNSIFQEYMNKLQTPERLAEQLTNLILEKEKIENNIKQITELLITKGVYVNQNEKQLDLSNDFNIIIRG